MYMLEVNIEYTISKFADDKYVGGGVDNGEDCLRLQQDIDQTESNPDKCILGSQIGVGQIL